MLSFEQLFMLLLSIMFLIFLIGISIGSFLNVIILRGLANESIVKPRSKCPKCQNQLKWYHNIPILSYIILRGKCAYCKEKISIQYPLIELFTGLMFVGIFFKVGLGFNMIFLWYFASILIILAITDLKEKIIFDTHAYFLLGGGLLYNLFNIPNLYQGQILLNLKFFQLPINGSILASFGGIILGIILMELLARTGYIFAGTRAFGEGDTYITAALGAVFGWRYIITIIMYALIIQVCFTIPIYLKKLFDKKDFKTFYAFIGFFIYLAIMITLNLNFKLNETIYTIMVIILGILGSYICYQIIKNIRTEIKEFEENTDETTTDDKKEERGLTFLPFGPALVVASFIAIFLIQF